MSLAERVNEVRRVSKGPDCNVRIALAQLGQDDADAMLHLIYKRLDLTGTDVSDIFVEEGIKGVTYQTVNRHRAGRCTKCREV